MSDRHDLTVNYDLLLGSKRAEKEEQRYRQRHCHRHPTSVDWLILSRRSAAHSMELVGRFTVDASEDKAPDKNGKQPSFAFIGQAPCRWQ